MINTDILSPLTRTEFNSNERQNMSNLTATLESKAELMTSDVKENLGSSVKQAQESAPDFVALFTEKKDQAVAWAKENPLTAAAVGVGIGFLFGSLVRRAVNRRS